MNAAEYAEHERQISENGRTKYCDQKIRKTQIGFLLVKSDKTTQFFQSLVGALICAQMMASK